MTTTTTTTKAGAMRERPALPHDGHLYRDATRDCVEALIPTPRPSNHAPSILELPDGALLAAWFAGSDEGNNDIDILVSRFEPDLGAWGAGVAVTNDPLRSDQNPSLFLHPDGDVWLVHTSQMSRQSGIPEEFNLQFTSVVRRVISSDGGRTWSDPELMLPREGTFCRQPIQVLASGRWVFTNWLCFDDDTKNGSDLPLVQVSDDQGGSWREVTIPDSAGRVHPNVVELSPGHLVALFRSRYADWIYLSRSEDDGLTWSAPGPTELPNNNAGISGFRLPSGRLAVVYNEQQFNTERGRVLWPYERSSLSIAVSDDAGRTWPVRRVLEPGEGFTGRDNLRSNRRYEYPHAIVARDGRIHVAYSFGSRVGIKHVVFAEQWIYGEAQRMHADCKLWT
jgi:predicted neuraminidase